MTFSFAALPALALLAAPVLAQDGAYLELGAGLTSTSKMEGLVGDAAFDAGTSFAALVGYKWEDAIAGLDLGLEGEGIWTLQNFDDDLLGPGSSQVENLSTKAYLIGASLTWPCNDEISFYAGAGAGIATDLGIKSRGDAASAFKIDDSSIMIYQGKAGIRYRMGGNLSWYLQYRRMQTESVVVRDDFLDQQFDYKFEQDIIEVGMRYGL
jgi:opacity protein-like surface antigen